MNPRRKGLLLIAAAAILWSSGGIGIKAVSDPPLKVAFYRSLFAGIALLVLFGRDVWGRKRWTSTGVFAAAIISYVVCLTTFVVATKWTTAANAIFLQYAGVVWVLIFSPVVTREPMRLRDVAAIAVAMTGMALFFVGRFETRGMAGNLMALVSSVFFAALILALRRENHAAESAIIWGNVAVSTVLLPFVASDLALTRRSLIVLLLLGLFQLAAPYVLFVRGLRYVTATQASLTGMLEPIANPLWVFLFLGETPSRFAIAGAVVVLCAIGWHTLAAEPATELPAVD
ncbi:MAG TPA: DMT family transporter [Thermoanaerobaculia bacterium]|nr:DMT family transporter [Thermoanaerobaculia bacterium]